MQGYRRWVIGWVVLLVGWPACMGLAFLTNVQAFAVLSSIGWIASMVYSGFTLYRLRRLGGDVPLLRPVPYRAIIGLLLVTSAVATIAAASIVITDPLTGKEHLETAALAVQNVLVAILAWRAWVLPSPRRAALVGAVALIGGLIAMIIDASLRRIDVPLPESNMGMIVVANLFVSALIGGAACAAAFNFFGENHPHMPEAQVVT